MPPRTVRWAFACLALAVACRSLPSERVRIPRLEGEWIQRSRSGGPEGPGHLTELVPAEESFGLWTRLVSVQFVEDPDASPRELMERILARLRSSCPATLVSRVVAEDARSITYEWWIDACPAAPDQHEVARILGGREGLHRVAFARKGHRMPDELRSRWLGRLGAAAVAAEDGRPREDQPFEKVGGNSPGSSIGFVPQ